jgi:hypothetical protein
LGLREFGAHKRNPWFFSRLWICGCEAGIEEEEEEEEEDGDDDDDEEEGGDGDGDGLERFHVMLMIV